MPITHPADEPQGFAKYRRIAATTIVGLVLICGSVLVDTPIRPENSHFAVAHPKTRLWLLECLEIAAKIGDAVLIAAVIGFGIDVAIKSSLVKEVVRAAAPDLLGQHLPRPVWRALLNMFDVSLVRSEWRVEYELVPIDEKQEFLKVISTISGVIQNCGSTDETFKFHASVDPSFLLADLESRITRISAAPEFGTSIFDDRPDNATLLQPDRSKFIERPFLMLAQQKYKTCVQLEEYRPTSFILPLFTGTTVEKTIVKITYPQELLEVQVSTGSSDSLPPKVTTGVGKEWEILTPILPGQCVLAQWLPRPKELKQAEKPAPAPDAKPAPVVAPKPGAAQVPEAPKRPPDPG